MSRIFFLRMNVNLTSENVHIETKKFIFFSNGIYSFNRQIWSLIELFYSAVTFGNTSEASERKLKAFLLRLQHRW